MSAPSLTRSTIILAIIIAWQWGWAAAPAAAQRGFDVKPLGLLDSQRKQHKGKSLLRIGQSQAAAIEVLGKPTRRSKMYFEMDEDTAVVFHYRTNILYFLKDKLEGFELNDNTLAFGKSYEQAFRVGAKLTTYTKFRAPGAAEHISYAVGGTNSLRDLAVDTKPGKSRNISYQAVAYNSTRYGNVEYDGWFEILFGADHGIINIATGDI